MNLSVLVTPALRTQHIHLTGGETCFKRRKTLHHLQASVAPSHRPEITSYQSDLLSYQIPHPSGTPSVPPHLVMGNLAAHRVWQEDLIKVSACLIQIWCSHQPSFFHSWMIKEDCYSWPNVPWECEDAAIAPGALSCVTVLNSLTNCVTGFL